MSKFKESFTPDIAVIKQWERDMCIKFDSDRSVELTCSAERKQNLVLRSKHK